MLLCACDTHKLFDILQIDCILPSGDSKCVKRKIDFDCQGTKSGSSKDDLLAGQSWLGSERHRVRAALQLSMGECAMNEESTMTGIKVQCTGHASQIAQVDADGAPEPSTKQSAHDAQLEAVTYDDDVLRTTTGSSSNNSDSAAIHKLSEFPSVCASTRAAHNSCETTQADADALKCDKKLADVTCGLHHDRAQSLSETPAARAEEKQLMLTQSALLTHLNEPQIAVLSAGTSGACSEGKPIAGTKKKVRTDEKQDADDTNEEPLIGPLVINRSIGHE